MKRTAAQNFSTLALAKVSVLTLSRVCAGSDMVA